MRGIPIRGTSRAGSALPRIGAALLLSGAVAVHAMAAAKPARCAVHTVPAGASPSTVAVDGAARLVFVGNVDLLSAHNRITVLDAVTGRVRQTVAMSQRPTGVAVAGRAGRAVVITQPVGTTRVGSSNGAVNVLAVHAGSRPVSLLRATAVAGMPTGVVVDERTGRAFVAIVRTLNPGYPTGAVGMFDIRSGRALSDTALPHAVTALVVDAAAGRVLATSSIGTLTVFDAANGRLLRTASLSAGSASAAVDEKLGRLFVSNALNGTIGVFDVRTGRAVHVIHALPGGISTRDEVAVDQTAGRVFVYATGNALLKILQASSGRVIGQASIGEVFAGMAADAGHGHLFVSTMVGAGRTHYPYPGKITVLHTHRLSIVCAPATPRGPQAVAVDEGTGRAFIANSGSSSVTMVDVRR